MTDGHMQDVASWCDVVKILKYFETNELRGCHIYIAPFNNTIQINRSEVNFKDTKMTVAGDSE